MDLGSPRSTCDRHVRSARSPLLFERKNSRLGGAARGPVPPRKAGRRRRDGKGLARRESPEGSSPVVIKVMRASFGDGKVAPELVARKEALALGRLNEKRAAKPFRGSLRRRWQRTRRRRACHAMDRHRIRSWGRRGHYALGSCHVLSAQDWLRVRAIEGGPRHSLSRVGALRDPRRWHHSPGFSRPATCSAVASAKPRFSNNSSDFGVARAAGLELSFEGLNRERSAIRRPNVEHDGGPSQRCLLVRHRCLLLAYRAALLRRRYSDGSLATLHVGNATLKHFLYPSLCPRTARAPQGLIGIDAALARDPRLPQRPATAEQFSASILPWFGETHAGPQSSKRLLSAVRGAGASTARGVYQWSIRSRPAP